MNLAEYEGFIDEHATEANLTDDADVRSVEVDLLRRECIERMRINVGLIAENNELQRKMSTARRGCVYTYENGEMCGNFVDDPFCSAHGLVPGSTRRP